MSVEMRLTACGGLVFNSRGHVKCSWHLRKQLFFLGVLFKFPMSLDTCRVQPNSQRLRFIRGERSREREVCRNFAEVLI